MVAGYDHFLDLAGRTFPEFLNNLNNMHSHIAQSFKELDPPSFNCVTIDEKTFRFEYHSHRPGLARFVKGLLLGLSSHFNVKISVTYIGTINGRENSHEYRVEHTTS